ncbi:MAG TPA: hypothetical protein VH107_12665 [Lacipirellulaceae bacterium]|jgi:hypothetical protein|nr:hypothetical protein [Lacipirellulaceae bacterium]
MATGAGYFDLRQNQFEYWPNESLPTAGVFNGTPAACGSSVCDPMSTANSCEEYSRCDEDYWTSQCNRSVLLATVGMTIFSTNFHGSALSNHSADLQPSNDGSFNDVTYAPRVLLESQGPEWGFLGRFWYLSDGDAGFTPLGVGGSAIGLNSTTRTKAYTADFEANRRWNFLCNGGEIDTSFGIRYASFSADGVLSSVAIVGASPNVYDNFSAISNRFNGVGITSGISTRLPLAENAWLCRGCTLSLFGSFRGSAVFGDSNTNTTASSRITAGGVSFADADASADQETSALLIGETAWGLEWNRRWTCIPADAFFRIALEYQAWGLTSPAASSVSTSLTAGGHSADATATANDANMSLMGVGLTTGFTW